MITIGTPSSPTATKVVLCGSGELGKEFVIELQRYGVEVVWYVVPVGWTIYLVTCLVGYFRIRRTAV